MDAAEELIASASVAVLQMEVPLETVRHAAAMCRRLGVFTLLDPAPVPVDPTAPAQLVVFTVNQGRVHKQPVSLGLSDTKNTEILQGVVPEDPIDVKFEALIDTEVTDVAENGTALLVGTWRTAKAKSCAFRTSRIN